MSTFFVSYVLRICDRLFDRRSVESIDRQGQLNQVLVVVLIFHLIMGISFVKMEEYEKKHPRVVRDVDISFLCSAPPPLAEFRVGEIDLVPRALNLTRGDSQDTGADSRQAASKKTLTLPTPLAEEKENEPLREEARQTRQSQNIPDAPLAITSNNPVKADPIRQARSDKFSKKDTDLTGNSSSLPASGHVQAGGKDTDNADDGMGGNGPGGRGKGNGENGEGIGNQGIVGGEPISTSLPVKTRAFGNIKLYQLQVEKKLRENWKAKSGVSLVVMIKIMKDGRCSCDVLSSSGNKRVDKDAVATIEGIDFDPLPEWYGGEDISFQYDMEAF